MRSCGAASVCSGGSPSRGSASTRRRPKSWGGLLTELEGEERLEALLARGRATLWTERDAETIDIAEEVVALAAELGAEEAKPAALARARHRRGSPATPVVHRNLLAVYIIEWL